MSPLSLHTPAAWMCRIHPKETSKNTLPMTINSEEHTGTVSSLYLSSRWTKIIFRSIITLHYFQIVLKSHICNTTTTTWGCQKCDSVDFHRNHAIVIKLVKELLSLLCSVTGKVKISTSVINTQSSTIHGENSHITYMYSFFYGSTTTK